MDQPMSQPELEPAPDVVAQAHALGAVLADRAAAADEQDGFVSGSFDAFRRTGLVAAAVPAELGGAGAGARELAEMLRVLARACSSSALAFSMHTHLVATTAWRWRHLGAPVEPLLRGVARDRLVLLSTGGNDWLEGSGTARPVDGGYAVTARKTFVSGAPAGDRLLTMAVLDDPASGPTVLHFAVDMRAPGISIEPTWRALGMRGTGSHDVVLEDVFVPEAAVSVRRPKGRWHPSMHVVVLVAIPLIYAVYLGVAEAALDRAVELAGHRRRAPGVLAALGELRNALQAARLAQADMVEVSATAEPGQPASQRIETDRALVGDGVRRVLDLALDVGGGASFYRRAGLERLFRDVQGSRYHPLPDVAQRELSGRDALGLPWDA